MNDSFDLNIWRNLKILRDIVTLVENENDARNVSGTIPEAKRSGENEESWYVSSTTS